MIRWMWYVGRCVWNVFRSDTTSVQDVWQHSLCVWSRTWCIYIIYESLSMCNLGFGLWVTHAIFLFWISLTTMDQCHLCNANVQKFVRLSSRAFQVRILQIFPWDCVDWCTNLWLFQHYRRRHNFRLSHTDTHFTGTTNHHLDARTIASERPDWYVSFQVLFDLWPMKRSSRDPPTVPVEGSYMDGKMFEPHTKAPDQESQEDIASSYSASKVS